MVELLLTFRIIAPYLSRWEPAYLLDLRHPITRFKTRDLKYSFKTSKQTTRARARVFSVLYGTFFTQLRVKSHNSILVTCINTEKFI